MTPEAQVIELMLKIPNKNRETVPFILNPAQRAIDSIFAPRMTIPKFRQGGVSAYILARFLIDCLNIQNTVAVVISHEAEATKRLFGRLKFYLDNLDPPAVIKTNSETELSFPKTNSVFFIGTAGSRKFGRGDTISRLHCSEVAFWPEPKGTTLGLFQAVPLDGGQIFLESTGNGSGTWYHRQCLRAQAGQSRFKLCFLAWQDFPEYQLSCTEEEGRYVMENLNEDWDEPNLVRLYKLTPQQVLYRRWKIEEAEYDVRNVNQEYPFCLDDCFQSTGSGVFQTKHFEETADWKRVSAKLHILSGHPIVGHSYVLGCDVGGGTGNDSSVIEVFDAQSNEQVAEYRDNLIAPDVFGQKIVEVGTIFNMAYVGVESNNHGLVTLKEIRDDTEYPAHLIHKAPAMAQKKDVVGRLMDLGLRTTRNSKPVMIGKLRKALAQEIIIHSPILSSEVSTFVEYPDGTMGAQEGCHDDTVMAAAVAQFVRDKALLVLSANPEPPQIHVADPFELSAVLKELEKRHSPNSLFPEYFR